MREAARTGLRRRVRVRSRRDPGPLARAVARMLVRAADGATRLVTDLLGTGPAAGRERISEAELRDLVAANTVLDPDERRIIDEVLVAGASLIREVMMPRTEVVFLPARLTIAEAARLVRAEPHSRYPVTDGTHDDVVGFVHLRDVLLRPDADPCVSVGELAREVKRLPGSKPVLPALSEMRREGQHLAVVVDEYGGTAGIVTLEDLIEELIGEIHDEYDATPDPAARRPAGRGGRPAQPRRLRRKDRAGAARRAVRDGRRVRDGRAGPAPGARRRGAGARRARRCRHARHGRPAEWLAAASARVGRPPGRPAHLSASRVPEQHRRRRVPTRRAGSSAGGSRGQHPAPAGRGRPAGPS